MADLIEEVADHTDTILRMVHFRVILDTIKSPYLIGNGSVGAHLRVSHQSEALRDLCHVIPMAHPRDALGREVLEKPAGGVIKRSRLAILPRRILLGWGNQASQVLGQQLTAIADPQNGDVPGENFWVHLGRSL